MPLGDWMGTTTTTTYVHPIFGKVGVDTKNVKKKTSQTKVEKPITIETQQTAAATLLEFIRDEIDGEAIVAGGAPRDWYAGQLATDIDVYVRSFVKSPRKVAERIRQFIAKTWKEPVDLVEKSSKGLFPKGVKINALAEAWVAANPEFEVAGDTPEIGRRKTSLPDLEILEVINLAVKDVNFDIILYKPSGNLLPMNEVLSTFDCGICKALFTGGYVFLHKDAEEDFKNKTITVYDHAMSKEDIDRTMDKHIKKIRAKYPDFKVKGSTKGGGRVV